MRSSDCSTALCRGFAAGTSLVFFYAGPLSTLVKVMRNRDSSSLNPPLSIMAFINMVMWLSYGLVSASCDARLLALLAVNADDKFSCKRAHCWWLHSAGGEAISYSPHLSTVGCPSSGFLAQLQCREPILSTAVCLKLLTAWCSKQSHSEVAHSGCWVRS